MNFDKVVNNLSRSVDPGAVLQQELEEAISPITSRVDRLEKKIDMLILLMRSIDDNLKKLQPLYDVLIKLPFFKK
jgi:chaperonin cofactor prefoldin